MAGFFLDDWKLVKRPDSFRCLEIGRMAGYLQMAGNQYNGCIFKNGQKLLERLDDDKWLEISGKARDCQMAGNEYNGWIF